MHLHKQLVTAGDVINIYVINDYYIDINLSAFRLLLISIIFLRTDLLRTIVCSITYTWTALLLLSYRSVHLLRGKYKAFELCTPLCTQIICHSTSKKEMKCTCAVHFRVCIVHTGSCHKCSTELVEKDPDADVIRYGKKENKGGKCKNNMTNKERTTK